MAEILTICMRQVRFWEKPRKPKFRVWPFGFCSVWFGFLKNEPKFGFHTSLFIDIDCQLYKIIYKCMYVCVQSGPLLSSFRLVHWLESMLIGRLVIWSTKKLYAQFVLGYALVGFCLFTFERYSVVCILVHSGMTIVLTGPWKLKVLEFFVQFFKAWKVLEKKQGLWKHLNQFTKVLERVLHITHASYVIVLSKCLIYCQCTVMLYYL